MRLLKCPVCKKPARLMDGIFKNTYGRYYVKCGCLVVNMRGHNKPDLAMSWNQWVKTVKNIEGNHARNNKND